MMEVKGAFNSALCYCDELEDTAAEQIRIVCEQPEFADSTIRIMPDVHAGKGCTIGTTMTIKDKVVPGMVGVDIGCGMETVEIAERDIDYEQLDAVIRSSIPAGREIREDYHVLNDKIDLSALRCAKSVHLDRARHSIGTLGGGNHFIEVDRADNGILFVVVHSGSRHVGLEVAEYYQDEAYKQLSGNSKAQLDKVIAQLKAEGREREIQSTVKRLKSEGVYGVTIPKDLAYVSGSLFDDYVHDMKIIQSFAALNRQAMTEVILREMGLTRVDEFTTTHNYIDTDSMILRKGAVSAKAGERLLIPINMRDGSLICVGKGNDDWNCSAPHGAGRIMSRKAAFGTLSMEKYREQMKGVFTTSVTEGTIDESPMAYKGMESIVSHIAPTVDITSRVTSVYNFKASE
ncbi:MAG: RtcB family protein [Coriobacteriales bacterium]|jgi:RNA-splicing ligase RtcB|nr:RtcB family protein [Coriobacteriales bacterium]